MAAFPVFRGLLGHQQRAVIALADFWGDLLDSDETAQLIMTGDLTATGNVAEFELGHDFLTSGTAPSGFGFGLSRQGWEKSSVAGNHDNWPGKIPPAPLGRSDPALRRYFPGPYPIIHEPLMLANGASVRFLFLDSDADVSPFGVDRLLARGKFRSQIDYLRKNLVPPKPSEFRALVLHHSVTREGAPPWEDRFAKTDPGLPLRRLVIDPDTLRELELALVEFGVKVLLCGHLHAARLSMLSPSTGLETVEVLEARCGATTQLDVFPNGFSVTLPPNTLIVHNLIEIDGKTVWRSKIHWLTLGNRFVPAHPAVHQLPPSSSTAEIVVVPQLS